MRKLVIDGAKIFSRAELFECFYHFYEVPAYSSHNLDALYDVLSTQCQASQIIIQNKNRLADHLGERYTNSLLSLLERLSRQSLDYKIIIEN